MPARNGEDIFKSLNKAQCRAVSSDAPTVAIMAGPGSGKTHTLTSRIVWLIDHIGIQPEDIIVATFTKKASNEMKERVGHVLGDGREKKLIMGTFHSIARRYLARYGRHIGLDPKFGIADDSDSKGILARICKRLDTHIDPATARHYISRRKAKGTSDESTLKGKDGKSIESRALESCFQEYQGQLERSNLLDYDDLLVHCVELLRKFPQCVSNIQAVLIDEYQDTNGVQYDLMRLFAQARRRITIVGDPDQSIYGWRSAEIKNLHRLLRDYPGTDEIALEENYRSSSYILDTSLKVIQQDKARYKKMLLPVRDKGTRPVLRKLKSAFEEADWIVSEIKRIQVLSGNMLNFDDFAILLRTSALSRHVESSLARDGIAYKMVGGFKFFDRIEIKVLLDYMRIIHQPNNNDALARIINVPRRGIGEATIKALLEEAEKSSMSLWQLIDSHCRGNRKAKTTIRQRTETALSGGLLKPLKALQEGIRSSTPSESPKMSLVDLIQRLIRDLKFEDYLEATYGPEHELRWTNVQEFVTLAEEFTRQDQTDTEALPTIEGIAQSPDDDTLARFLSNISLASDKQTEDPEQEGKPHVTVSTIHAAKGLEWPVVFIPGVYNGSIPHIRSEDQDEERRLLYVAMTRAKALLYLSCPATTAMAGGKSTELSCFISAIASQTFLPKGPSFDRPVMAGVAKILGRELPPDSVIYQKMPSMTAPEDSLFPEDPNKPLSHDTRAGEVGYDGGLRKRQKTQHPVKSVQVAEESVEGWVAPYKTTMEKAGSFTVPQSSGFTTAGAHMAIVAAAEARKPSRQAAPAPVQATGPRRTTSNRPPNQRSLLGYGYGVTNHDQSKSAVIDTPDIPTIPKRTLSAQAPYARRRPNHTTYPLPSLTRAPAPAPAIEPALADHKLGSLPKLPASKPTTIHRDEATSSTTSRSKQYACFSSSPTKPPPPPPPEPEPQLNQPPAPKLKPKPTPDKENVSPEEYRRPASSFHTTTVTGPLGWRTGIKRPAGLGRSGIAPMEKLNKPYKLTVKRPS
ncbi:UvrD-helicase-domain-containing protein [Poronia punctata]|nr:UvrD-helicase-domain-containing protein [Poronia punctata]